MPRWLAIVIAVLVLAGLAAGGVSLYRWAQERQADADAARAAARVADDGKLKAENLTAATIASKAELERERDALVAGNDELRAEIERLKRALPAARVTSVESTHTGPVKADGIPPAASTSGEAGAEQSAAPCLIRKGDDLDLKVSELTAEARSGAVALLGTAEAWRLLPLPQTMIARKELHGTYLQESSSAPACSSGAPWWSLAASCAVCGGVGASAGVRLVR